MDIDLSIDGVINERDFNTGGLLRPFNFINRNLITNYIEDCFATSFIEDLAERNKVLATQIMMEPRNITTVEVCRLASIRAIVNNAYIAELDEASQELDDFLQSMNIKPDEQR